MVTLRLRKADGGTRRDIGGEEQGEVAAVRAVLRERSVGVDGRPLESRSHMSFCTEAEDRRADFARNTAAEDETESDRRDAVDDIIDEDVPMIPVLWTDQNIIYSQVKNMYPIHFWLLDTNIA